jgi:hypothetical protein
MPEPKSLFLSVGDEKIPLHRAELSCKVTENEKVEVECLIRYTGEGDWDCEREIDLPVLIETLQKVQSTQEPAPAPGILTWDHREQINLEDLSKAVWRFYQPSLHQIDTGADFYAIVVGPKGWSQEDALEFYRNHWNS